MRPKIASSLMFLAMTLCFGASSVAFAAEEEKPKIETAKVNGEVTAVSLSGIAVQYGTAKDGGGKEIYLPLNDKTKLQRFQSPAQLKVGDTVQVVYERKYQEPEKGKKIYLGAAALEVVLLKQAPGEGALVSRGEGAQ